MYIDDRLMWRTSKKLRLMKLFVYAAPGGDELSHETMVYAVCFAMFLCHSWFVLSGQCQNGDCRCSGIKCANHATKNPYVYLLCLQRLVAKELWRRQRKWYDIWKTPFRCIRLTDKNPYLCMKSMLSQTNSAENITEKEITLLSLEQCFTVIEGSATCWLVCSCCFCLHPVITLYMRRSVMESILSQWCRHGYRIDHKVIK